MNCTVTLRKHEDKRIRSGHLWAFSNEIARIDGGAPESGDLVTVRDHAGNFVGVGFYNPHSLISVRIISFDEDATRMEELDSAFFLERISSALKLRTMIFPGADSFRIVHGESDFLPGLIIDKYGDVVSIQTLSAGMDKHLSVICGVINQLLHPKAIIERNDVQSRTLEGLEQKKGIISGTIATSLINENGLIYEVDALEGQKTGFFLDQRENRFSIRKYVKDARTLDCFCNDGGFALNAAAGGAANVTAVDISERAIANATANAERNYLGNVRFEKSDAFEFLKRAVGRNERFDFINLDPPSFAPNKKSVHTAKKAYTQLHALAMKILAPGGILATSSCSHHIFEETFLQIINEAANLTGRQLSVLEWRGASPDHPSLPAMPETKYLKFGVFRVI